MSSSTTDSPWHRDERHREQLAVVVRDDLLGLSRYLINKKRVFAYEDEEERERIAPVSPSATLAKPSLILELISEVKALDGSSHECVSCSLNIVRKVLKHLDSAHVRFTIAERLLLLREAEDGMEEKYQIFLKVKAENENEKNNNGDKLEEFTDEERRIFRRSVKTPDGRSTVDPNNKAVEHFVKNLEKMIVEEGERKEEEGEKFEFDGETGELLQKTEQAPWPTTATDHVGIFNPADVQQLFVVESDADDNHSQREGEKYRQFITKMYRLVSQQNEPEEAIVDVLDKVAMLLKVKWCAFPKDVIDSPKKDNFIKIVRNEVGGTNLEKDVNALFGKARDENRPYTTGGVKPMAVLYNTDRFVLAAAKGDRMLLMSMIEEGQDVNDFSSTFRYTALHAASDFGHTRCVSLLLENEAIVNIRNKITGKTPLHYAAESRRFDVCRQLLESGASKRTRDMKGLNALYYANEVKEEESQIAARLLRDAPGRIFKINFVGTEAKEQTASITMDWAEPKNLGYDQDPIDHHRISWRAIRSRKMNDQYLQFLKLLALEDCEEEVVVEEEGWVKDDSEDKPYTIKNLKPAEEYKIEVQAHADGGYGVASHTVEHTSATSVPSIPGKPIFMTSTSTSVTISWLPPKFQNGEPVKSYQISRQLVLNNAKKGGDKKGGGEEQEAQWVTYMCGGGRPVFTTVGIPAGSFVMMKVKAKNANGFSEMGEIGGPFQALDPVRMLEKTPFSQKIIWQTIPAKTVLCFELQIRKFGLVLSEDDFEIVSDSIPQNIAGITYSIPNLLPGTEYQYRIRGHIQDTGWQKWHEGIVSPVFKTVNTVPDPCTQPYDKIGASTATTIVLKWESGASNGKAITEYEVWWKPNTFDWDLLETVKGPPQLHVENLEIGGSYLFKVRAKNELGWGPYSLESSRVTTNPIPLPGAPKMLKNGIGWIRLTWSPPGGAMLVDSYEVQKRMCITGALLSEKWEVVTQEVQGVEYLVQELRPCAQYEFRVRALTFDGWSSFSEVSGRYTTGRRH
ncbi:hypothetical protein TrLO_g10801 [Triparma laevis f. longispina]|uniref:Fibronectin type-III domain-containing protein n=1 Tax=Triparma laevis f. longispina TaxID=1714387 RepID=A0A9W7FQV0_9STRA|nr:hypothetical protein TrLO_g10801 [Triparma laevis f. longispina]